MDWVLHFQHSLLYFLREKTDFRALQLPLAMPLMQNLLLQFGTGTNFMKTWWES